MEELSSRKAPASVVHHRGFLRGVPIWIATSMLIIGAVALVLYAGRGRRLTRHSPSAEETSGRPLRPPLSDRQIAVAEGKIRTLPDNADAYAELSVAYMNKARASGDGSFYTRAEKGCQKALELDPKNYAAIRTLSWVYSGQHRFQEAQAAARRALALQPDDPWNYGMLGDALVELGDYMAAADAFQKMVNLRPDVGAYSRAAYIRELFGDPEGAIKIMGMAVNAAGSRDPESLAWCRTHLANVYFGIGNYQAADQQYVWALQVLPNYYLALAGRGRVAAALANYSSAAEFYEKSVALVPTLDAVIALGDLYSVMGDTRRASERYGLVDYIEEINRTNKIQPEAQRVLFLADQNRSLKEALAIAEARIKERHDIRTYDALAWAYYKMARYADAKAAMKQALRLGTKDALFLYHAGMIAQASGNRSEAKTLLRQALETSPRFHPLHSKTAAETLAKL